MRSVTSSFRTEMVKQTLNTIYRRFKYDGTDRSDYPESYGNIILDAKQITAGAVSIGLVNTDKLWNMFLSDITNLRKTATVELGLEVSGSPEYVTFFTGLGDEPQFDRAYLNLQLRDKMAKMLQKKVGSGQGPVNYYSSAYNPADLVWDLLTNYGELDDTQSSANTDIDYDIWSNWKQDCSDLDLSIKAELEGEYISTILDKIAYLTKSIIFVRGDSKFIFYRFVPSPDVHFTFDDDNIRNEQTKQTFEELLNYVKCYYGYDPTAETWAGNVIAEDATSQANYGKISHTEEDTAVWHATQTSAQEFCNRYIERYKDPREYCRFETGIMGFIFEPGDIIYNSISFYGYSTTDFEIKRLQFNLTQGMVDIEALNAEDFILEGFRLDDAVDGLLDQSYNPLW
jgi:hypothetical protein